MPETERDLRAHRILLVSHSILAGPRSAALARSAVDWAAGQRVGLYQLPLPAHELRPRTPSGRLARLSAADLRAEARELDAVFEQTRDYLAAGYDLLGLALLAQDTASAAGRDWLARLLRIAATHEVDLPVWRVARDADRFAPAIVGAVG
jgi:hypothetical protein